MAAPVKQASRWGSFLQQAVAGVESRLDTILAEAEEPSKGNKPAPATTPAPKPNTGNSRSSSSTRTSDRLQERLARAVAAKNKAQSGEPLDTSSNAPSRTGSPVTNIGSPRGSIEVGSVKVDEANDEPAASSQEESNKNETRGEHLAIAQPVPTSTQKPVSIENPVNGLMKQLEDASMPRLSTDSDGSSRLRDSIDLAGSQALDPPSMVAPTSSESSEEELSHSKPQVDYETQFKQLQGDYEASELQRQEEVHGYIERIDALQAKLQYLAKESAEAARKSADDASPGSLQKKLAEKEEQIALLMQEGQQLSKNELKHLTTIKKLRGKIGEDSKELADAKKKQEKAEKDVSILIGKLNKSEQSEKRLNEKQKSVMQLQKEIELLQTERASKDASIADLRTQLEQTIAQGKEAENQAAQEALDQEKKRVAELEEEIASLKIEKNLVVDRGQARIKELKEKMERDAEHSRMSLLEMKTEQQMLESKLEVMRARAEEVSSGATGDAQAKLLRQIETLQTQYAVASENWQGIEASLIARVANLEKERDGATQRETEIRRKAREVTLKSKHNEEDLEETKSKIASFQHEIAAQRARIDSLQQRAETAEAALKEARATFDEERLAWKSEIQQRIDEERQRWQEEAPTTGSLGYTRAESPIASSRRGLTSEYLGLQNLQIRRASARSVTSDIPGPEKIFGRRPSVQPPRSSGQATPVRQDSMQSLGVNGEVPRTPSIHTMDHDDNDFFENIVSSPQQTMHDMVSVSTAGAGPTVQLVERMSSAVRRLESEKVATKEDIARLTAQRDEARAEIVALMRGIEEKKSLDVRITQLEEENANLNSRYQTTLEMLGEKSELVDELRSDIDDIKAMYRELVERTVR
ncbi:hypothetical protein B7463_g1007, partial [Scytalidium lignicola]